MAASGLTPHKARYPLSRNGGPEALQDLDINEAANFQEDSTNDNHTR